MSDICLVGPAAGFSFSFFAPCAFIGFPALPNKMALGMSRLTQQLVNPTHENPQGTQIWADVVGNVEERLAALSRTTPRMDLGNPGAYMEFAIFPHAKRHAHVEAFGIKT